MFLERFFLATDLATLGTDCHGIFFGEVMLEAGLGMVATLRRPIRSSAIIRKVSSKRGHLGELVTIKKQLIIKLSMQLGKH